MLVLHDSNTVMNYSTVCTSLKLPIQKLSSIFLYDTRLPKIRTCQRFAFNRKRRRRFSD